jgi:predicted DNA-binding transcriptional regulator AlpA
MTALSNTAAHMINQDDGHLTATLKNRRPHSENNLKKYLSIKEIASMYSMSIRVLYNIIKTDPSFPYVNMGVKKKLMIDHEAFETWLMRRTYQEQKNQFRIPDLMELTNKR